MSDRNIPTDERSQWVQPGNWAEQYGGLTKRELFAAMAMQATISAPGLEVLFSGNHPVPTVQLAVAKNAVAWADALLAALEVSL